MNDLDIKKNDHQKPKNNLILIIIALFLGISIPYSIGIVLGVIVIISYLISIIKYNEGNYSSAQRAAKYSKYLSCTIIISFFIINIYSYFFYGYFEYQIFFDAIALDF